MKVICLAISWYLPACREAATALCCVHIDTATAMVGFMKSIYQRPSQ